MSGTALAVHDGGKGELASVQSHVRGTGLIRPIAAPTAVLEAQNETREMVRQALKDGRDYGTIPGVNKPSLLKPGAERLTLAFGLTPRFRIIEQEVDHDREVKWIKRKRVWKNEHQGDRRYDEIEEAGMSLGLYRFVFECELVQRETGATIATCVASCSSMESKYIDRPRDVENTIAKMSQKRAFVGATLLALGLSDEFTQDVEDTPASAAEESSGGTAEGAGSPSTGEPIAKCPKCGGNMWDNRLVKRNAKAPDYKCRDRGCDGVYWPGQFPPKPAEDESTQADAFDESAMSANEKLTRDSEYPRGKFKGTKVRDLPEEFLWWATAEGRNLGDRTADWQDVFSLELDERASGARDNPTQEAAEAGSPAAKAFTPHKSNSSSEKADPDDDLPF